jgi:NAD(P)-dependent dehydrogenase (short-subunit alcohol dehydrogenase family)
MKMRTWLQLASFTASMSAGVAVARNIVRAKRTIDVAGKTVVITGGSRGLGLVLARGLLERGARVAICARDSAELDRARAHLLKLGGDVYAATCDVSDRDDVLRFITSVEDDFGAIDVLINNAGIIQVGPLAAMTEEDFELALDVNFFGPLHTIYAVLPGMRRRKAGRIVNIASIGGKVAIPHLAPYSASKFALVGLSEALRAELTGDSIYVTTVVPGLIRTGSPRHAWFKGKVQAEYAWFAIGDSNSLTSISAESASEQIITALTRGDAGVVISPQAKLMSLLHGIAPNLVQEMLSVVARVMPGATRSRSAVEGKDAESVFAPSPLTRNSDEAAARNNEN